MKEYLGKTILTSQLPDGTFYILLDDNGTPAVCQIIDNKGNFMLEYVGKSQDDCKEWIDIHLAMNEIKQEQIVTLDIRTNKK